MRRAALLGALALTGCGGGGGSPGRGPEPRPAAPAPAPPPARQPYDGLYGAKLLRPTALRTRPGGAVVARLPQRTPFGSLQILAVAKRRPGWLGVRSAERPEVIGWIRARDAELLRETWEIAIDLSERRLTVRNRGHREFSFPVAIGKPDTPTPTGRFGVTDRLKMTGGDTYGCCALALTARQPHIPQGWGGGDRVAIHGTSAQGSIGTAASNGCLRASDADLRRLLDVIPLGATVDIRA